LALRVMRSVLAAAAALLAAVVCVVALSTESLPFSLVSVAQARTMAARAEAMEHLDFRSATQESMKAERDQRLAAKDSAIRRSILRAAAAEKQQLQGHGRSLSRLEERERGVLHALRGLEGGVAEAKRDEARSSWMMRQHLLATNRILGEVQSLAAEKAHEGKHVMRLDESLEGTDKQLDQALANLNAGKKVLQSGREAEVEIADKARQAAAEGQYEDSVDRVLEARSKTLQRSAELLQKRGGERASRAIQHLAAREMLLENEAGEVALAVAKLRSKAHEAQGYVGVLDRDMREAERRVDQQADRVQGLYRRAKQQRLAAMVAAHREHMFGSEVQHGIGAVLANEEAFRRNEARLKGDEMAVSKVEPRLRETRKTLRSTAQQVGRDIKQEEKEGLVYVGDVREARSLQQARGLHKVAGQDLAKAAAVRGEGAELLLDQGKHYVDLSKVDVQDANDSKGIGELEWKRGW